MIFKFTCKHCRISNKSQRDISKHLAKLNQMLPDVQSDLVVLRLTIKKNIDKYYPLKKAYQKPSLAYFEGSMTFRLNKNRFYTHFKGATIDECIKVGFERLSKEIEKYKDLHFSSESDYPDHRSIREVRP